jgi:nitrogen fixation/metabolism regulation signal transduction histidine kinase
VVAPQPHLRPSSRQHSTSYETRILLLALGVGAVPIAVLAVVLWQLDASPGLAGTALGIALLAWLIAAHRLRFEVVYHLQTLANLLEALREGDFSLRGRRARRDDALGEVVLEVNALAQTLREQRLEAREASALLQKVVVELEIAVLAFDRDGSLKLANPAGARLFASSPERLLGKSAEQLGLAELLAGPSSSIVQRTFPGGTGRWDVRHATFREAGIEHRLMVISDLSRALREEERKAWQRLIRVIGHELNNSLAPIMSMAATLRDLIAREPLPADWRDDVGDGLTVVGDRAGALSRFMTAYATLARLPSPNRRAVDLAQLAKRVAALETRLPVRTEGASLKVEADADQLEQALINLVKNAVDASEGKGRVLLRWRATGDGTIVEVLDEGPGIANADNLFVPFFTTKPGGSGIGLVLSRQIVEGHGGTLTLENRGDARGCVARVNLR